MSTHSSILAEREDSMKRQKAMTITNSPRKNEVTRPRQKRRSVMDVSGGDKQSPML